LPGLGATAQAADSEGFSFEYQHYSEGQRNLDGQKYSNLGLTPLEADSLALNIFGEAFDRTPLQLNYSQDTWSGATPVTTVPHAAVADQIFAGASVPTEYFVDAQHQRVDVDWSTYDGQTVQSVRDNKLVHVMGSASPETRRQIETKIGHAWDDGTIFVGAGISDEPDYKSYFVNTDGQWDLDGGLATLSWSGSLSTADIAAALGANSAADWGYYIDHIRLKDGESTLVESRHGATASLGLSRVLDADTVLAGSISFAHDAGYLSNPYKATILAFDDPYQVIDSTGLRTIVVKGSLEQRPRLRNQWTFDGKFVRYFSGINGALHIDYSFYRDDWSIIAHTLDISWVQPLDDGWSITPDVRYYTQSAARFYQPFFYFAQAFPILLPRNPELPPQLDHSQIALRYFSSDERLSAYGTLNAQLSIDKQLGEHAKLEVGAEYSRHAGSLRILGHGEQSFANFDSYTVYASLSVDNAPRAPNILETANPFETDTAAGDILAPGIFAPAGVEYVNALSQVGAVSLVVTNGYSILGSKSLHGSHGVNDAEILSLGCGATLCTRADSGGYSNLTRIDLSYAPTSWITIGIRPSFADAHLDEHALFGFAPLGGPGAAQPSFHQSAGGLSDTSFYMVSTWARHSDFAVLSGLDISAPTGSVNNRVTATNSFMGYYVQQGAGIWTLHPSLSVLGAGAEWTWGGQVSASVGLQSRNSAGYAPGNAEEVTAWAGYNVDDIVSFSLRGILDRQNAIRGNYHNHIVRTLIDYQTTNGIPQPIYEYDSTPQDVLAPSDLAQNSGGTIGSIALGTSFQLPSGPFSGNRLSAEWVVPIWQHLRGYQSRRSGSLNLAWGIVF